MIAPLGYFFRPTDEQLISGYLLTKVMGLSLPCNVILEKGLYGQNTAPCDVFIDIDESDSFYWHPADHETKGVVKKTIYVFTKLVKAGSNSSRITRRAGSGTWSGQTGARKIKNFKGEIIGSRKMFAFEDSAENRGGFHWIMHEYSLDGIYKNLGPNNINNDLVLCKITRSFKGTPTTNIENNGPVGPIQQPAASIENNGSIDQMPQPEATIENHGGVDQFSQPGATIEFENNGSLDQVQQPVATIENNGDGQSFPSACTDEAIVDQLPQLAAIENSIVASPWSLMSDHKRSWDEGGVPLLEDCETQINPKKPRNCEDLLGNRSLAQGVETNVDINEIFAALPDIERLECSMAKTNNIEASGEGLILLEDSDRQNGCDPRKPTSDDDSYVDFLVEHQLADLESDSTYDWFEGLPDF